MLIMTVGSFGSKLLSFLLVPFYTSRLTAEEYGTADLIATVVSLLLPFFTLIICEAMMRFALEKTNDARAVFAVGMQVTLGGTAVFLLLSPLLLLTPLRTYYIYLIAYYICSAVHQSVSYFVRGYGRVGVFAVGGIIDTAVLLVCSILFLTVFDLGLGGYLLAMIAAQAVSVCYMFFAAGLHRLGSVVAPADRELRRQMLRFAVPMIPNSAGWWLVNASGRLLLSFFLGSGATGLLAAAYKIPNILTTFTSLFGRAWKLTAAEDFGSEASRRFSADLFLHLTSILAVGMSGLLLINRPLAALLFRGEFVHAYRYVPFLLMSALMHAYTDFYGAVYTASYRTRFLFVSTVLGGVLGVLLNLILIPILGIAGAAVAAMLGQAAVFVCRAVHSHTFFPIAVDWRRCIFCYVLLGVQMTAAALTAPAVLYPLSAAVFVLLLLLFRRELLSAAGALLGGVSARLHRR